jgi:hypothetical protein
LAWLQEQGVREVVMESSGWRWKRTSDAQRLVRRHVAGELKAWLCWALQNGRCG